MLTEPEFMHSKIIVVWSLNKEKISFLNDNLIITDENSKVKLQCSCYKLFAIFIVGGTTLTTGIIERSKRFGFSIVLFSASFKVYETINFKTEGNTLLRDKQYRTKHFVYIARQIVSNKIENQITMLKKMRDKNCEGLDLMQNSLNELENALNIQSIMGFEGTAAKTYFNRIFKEFGWKGRQPRVKRDPVNVLLDFGYTVLFNYMDALLNLYGFDLYKGNLHQQFFKRKSLVCDMVEPFRPIIDYSTRKILNLNQITEQDWVITYDGRYSASWKSAAKIVGIFVQEISNHRQSLFRFVQSYYRWFMKNAIDLNSTMPKGEIRENDFDKL